MCKSTTSSSWTLSCLILMVRGRSHDDVVKVFVAESRRFSPTGVSATSLIRQFDDMTPIISMTSNSGPNEIMTYFSHGEL